MIDVEELAVSIGSAITTRGLCVGLRFNLVQLERALSEGVKMTVLVECVNAKGFRTERGGKPYTVTSFYSALHRARAAGALDPGPSARRRAAGAQDAFGFERRGGIEDSPAMARRRRESHARASAGALDDTLDRFGSEDSVS